MAYVTVENMVGGVDRTRPRFALPPGTIWSGINGHITRGGDFEKRKAFVEKYALPAGTFGLAKTTAGLYAFGSDTAPSMPTGVTYMQLQHVATPATAMSKILSWDLYDGKLYVIAQYEDDAIYHFYDGSAVSDWNQNSGGYPLYTGSARGTIVRTHDRKVYSPVSSVLWFSGVDTAIGWDSATDAGAGFQNVSTHQGGSDNVVGLITYQNYLAAFSRRLVQIWNMQADEANNAPVQVLPETGARAARSIIGFGDVDAFFLSDSGIRSIRSRDQNANIAGVNDVGTPIDKILIEHMATLTEEQIGNAVSAIEPIDGRFWMALGDRIYVFSYFPSKKISAWTWYEVDGLEFTDIVSFNGRLYLRAGDTVYLYGGDDNATYDDAIPTLALPFLTLGKPGHAKEINGVDVAAQGIWNVKLLVNPNDENECVDIGDLEDVTYQGDESGAVGSAHYVAPVLVGSGNSYSSVSSVTVYYAGTSTDS